MTSTRSIDIDLEGLKGLSRSGKRRIGREFGRSFETVGAVIVRNHGVSLDLIRDFRACYAEFYAQDMEYKLQYERPQTRTAARGYTCKREVSESGPGMERFSFGDFAVDRSDPYYGSEKGLTWFPDNSIPDRPSRSGEVAAAYHREMKRLAQRLFEIFELQLETPSGYFVDHIRRSTGVEVGILYPALSSETPGDLRIQPHTDSGILTILNTEPTKDPALQFLDVSGQWTDMQTDVDAFVLNVGDLLSRWTNGRWLSTVHRVLRPSPEHQHIPRLSIAYFEHPDYDANVVSHVPPGEQARFEPVNAGEFESRKRLEIHIMTDDAVSRMLHDQFDHRLEGRPY